MVDASVSHSRRGFTLTELAIVLGIIGLILGAIWGANSSVNEKIKINQAVEELQVVSSNIVSLMAGRPSSAPPLTDLTPAMIRAGVMPSWAVVSATKAANPWYGTDPNPGGGGASGLTVSSKTPSSGDPPNTGFRLALFGIPKDGCIALLTQGTSCQANQSGCPLKVYTNYSGSSLSPDPTLGWQVLDVNAAIALCAANAAPGAGTNSVEFSYSQ